MLWRTPGTLKHITYYYISCTPLLYKCTNVIGYFNPEWENELGVIYVFDYTNPEVQKYIIHVFTDNKKRG